jgi:hypothetical protein
VSLRGHPIEEAVTLPNGTRVTVRVAVAEDPYISKRELDTVALELRTADDVLAAVNTVLEPADVSEARALAREAADKLASGELEPTAGALEPLAASIPPVRE